MEPAKKTILDQLKILYYRKWLFIVPVVLGAAIGVYAGHRMPKYYSAYSLILAEEQQIPEQYVTPTDKTPFSQRLNAISQEVMSRARLEGIIKEFRLYNGPGWSLAALFRPARDKNAAAPGLDYYIDQMKQDIEFKATDESRKNLGGNTFTLTYSGTDPVMTMKITNRLASLFLEENLRERERYAEGTSEFLTEEMKSAKTDLDRLEAEVKGFKEAHMGSLPEQLESNLRTMDRLQTDLQNVIASIRSNEDKKKLLDEQITFNPGGQASILDPLAAELDRVRNELRVLQSMYKDNYPDVVIAKKQIKDIEAQMNARKGQKIPEGEYRNPAVYAELAATKSQISSLKQQEAQTRRQIADYQKRIERTPENEQLAANLMRDYRLAQQNYQALIEKKTNARLAQRLEKKHSNERFRIIDYATVPAAPYKPDRLKIGVIGTMAGVGTGTALVFLFELMNPAFRKPEDFDGFISSPVLTTIPFIPFGGARGAKLTVVKGRK